MDNSTNNTPPHLRFDGNNGELTREMVIHQLISAGLPEPPPILDYNVSDYQAEFSAEIINTESIGFGAFSGFTGLVSIDFLSTKLTNICKGAFSGCSNIVTIDFSKTQLANIGKGIFYDCVNLKSISFPSSLLTIGTIAFNECIRLQTINFKSYSPPEIESGFSKSIVLFHQVPFSFKMIIPAGTKDTYCIAFEKILEASGLSSDNIVEEKFL